MLGVDVGERDDVVEHGEEVPAGVQQEGFALGMHHIRDLAVHGQDVRADVVVRQQGGRMKAQVVAKAEHAKRFGEFLHKALPHRALRFAHALE